MLCFKGKQMRYRKTAIGAGKLILIPFQVYHSQSTDLQILLGPTNP